MDSNANWKPGDCRDKSPDSDGDLRALFGRLSPRDEELPRLDDLRRQVEARAAAEHATGRRPAGAAGWKGWNEMWNPARWSALRLAGAASLLLVVLACTVPLNYDREAGLTLDPPPRSAEFFGVGEGLMPEPEPEPAPQAPPPPKPKGKLVIERFAPQK